MIRANIDSDADVEIDDMKNKCAHRFFNNECNYFCHGVFIDTFACGWCRCLRYEVRLKSEEETGLGLLAEHTLLKKNDAVCCCHAGI